jgi:hypothetical protein
MSLPLRSLLNSDAYCTASIVAGWIGLLWSDPVLPTVDAGSQELYRRINRPHSSYTLRGHLEGLCEFRHEYTGNLWIEVMLLSGLNDSRKALEELATAIEPCAPEEVHISLPERPASEAWVQAAGAQGLLRALAVLGNVARVLHPPPGHFDFSGCDDVGEALVGVVTRHPMRELEREGRVQIIERHGERYIVGGAVDYAHVKENAP